MKPCAPVVRALLCGLGTGSSPVEETWASSPAASPVHVSHDSRGPWVNCPESQRQALGETDKLASGGQGSSLMHPLKGERETQGSVQEDTGGGLGKGSRSSFMFPVHEKLADARWQGYSQRAEGSWSLHIWKASGRGQSANASGFRGRRAYPAERAACEWPAARACGRTAVGGSPAGASGFSSVSVQSHAKVEIITKRQKRTGEAGERRGECATTKGSLAGNQETKCTWTKSSA